MLEERDEVVQHKAAVSISRLVHNRTGALVELIALAKPDHIQTMPASLKSRRVESIAALEESLGRAKAENASQASGDQPGRQANLALAVIDLAHS